MLDFPPGSGKYLEVFMVIEKYKEFNFRDFDNLDESEDADYLIDSMDEMFDVEHVQGIKQMAIENLNVKNGNMVLELGCGLGHDAETFGELVGDSGNVVAVDFSKKMISKAKMRSKHGNVIYTQANASNLDYPDQTFDICHADRLLLSQKDPIKILMEAIRLLKPGGKLSITDLDFGSIIFHPHDEKITPILKDRLQEIVLHPFIGRELHQRFNEQGLVNITVEPKSYLIQSFDKLKKIIDVKRILTDLCMLGRLSKEESEKQLSLFNEAEEKKMFLYSITFFTVQGDKRG